MTNLERIRKMDDNELADYIHSVYLAGKLCARYTPEGVNFKEWLEEESQELPSKEFISKLP